MKKFLAAMTLAVTLLICQHAAQAADVRLCDSNVEDVISVLERIAGERNIRLWGKNYYTDQGARRCELHFGDTDKDTIRFTLNDDAIANVLVTVRYQNPSELQNSEGRGFNAGVLAGAVLLCSGVSQSELKTLVDESTAKFSAAADSNPQMTHYHEETSVRCESIQRYVVWDYEVTETYMNIYLYAYK